MFHSSSGVLFFERPFQTAIGVFLAIAHMKAASSPAIAVTTALRFYLLPSSARIWYTVELGTSRQ